MRVRIIRWTDPTSSAARLGVDRWCEGQWEPVKDFGLYESNEANEFAMKLSMTKRVPVEMAVFEDGEKLGPDPVLKIGKYDPNDTRPVNPIFLVPDEAPEQNP
jgi:hypothetical protein